MCMTCEHAADAVAGSVADPLARGSLIACLMAFTIGQDQDLEAIPAVCAPPTGVVSDRCCVDCLTIAWASICVTSLHISSLR
jgi:hypothetical protein